MSREKKSVHSHWQRHYRGICKARACEVSFQLVVEESDLRVVAEHDLSASMLHTLRALRADVHAWTVLYPECRTSLAPLPLPTAAPEIVRRMYSAAQRAGVGPFAAVAGVIAHMLADEYAHASPNLLIENGGDIYMHSQRERHVALLAHPESMNSMKNEAHAHSGTRREMQEGGESGEYALGLRFAPEEFPLALCTSSATIGHSLSLGQGELAVVRASDGALADAVATALGNRLKSAAFVESAVQFAQSISGVDGVFVQCDDKIGAWGAIQLEVVEC